MFRRQLLALILLPSLLFVTQLQAEEKAPSKPGYPPRFQAVIDYLLNEEYPELFGDKPYHIRPTGFDIGDLDGDGVDEVVVSFEPHYRQSPTIMIFKVDNKMKVKRLTEALAPGRLVPVSGDYLDSHTIGFGIDMSPSEKDFKKPNVMKDFTEIALQEMGNVVEYKDFLHVDGRKGKGIFIDMTHIKNPPKDRTCESFEFEKVKAVRIMRRKTDGVPVILAATEKEAYMYTIKGISKNGMLDKELKIVPLGKAKK